MTTSRFGCVFHFFRIGVRFLMAIRFLVKYSELGMAIQDLKLLNWYSGLGEVIEGSRKHVLSLEDTFSRQKTHSLLR